MDSSLLSHALLGTIQSEVSTTLKLSPRLSFIPIQLQVYILELLRSHFQASNLTAAPRQFAAVPCRLAAMPCE